MVYKPCLQGKLAAAISRRPIMGCILKSEYLRMANMPGNDALNYMQHVNNMISFTN